MAKRGRKSKYQTHVEPYLDQIKAWKGIGYTDESICDALGISQESLCQYKRKYSELSEAFKNSKPILSALILNKMVERAIGYEHKETKAVYDKDSGQWKTIELIKRYPPDTTAGIFLECNLDPEHFKQKQEVTNRIVEVPSINLILEQPEED